MKEKIIQNTVLRFILVGVINTLVGTAIMFGLYNLAHCSYWVSSASNYILTSILSFFLNKFFTFQNKEKSLDIVFRKFSQDQSFGFQSGRIHKPFLHSDFR